MDKRPIWVTEDDHIALRYILKGSAGGADLRKWAMSMCERYHAAPDDSVEAVREVLMQEHAPTADNGRAWTDAVLRALGMPNE